jgi:8-oxo-dGTP pyrophosphatase MutT (NUDIX family)
MRQPIQVLVYPVRVTKGDWEYLLLRRIASRGSFWQGVTGGVEEDEEILDAARRELREKTGLAPSRLQRIDYTYAFPVEDKWRHIYAEGVKEVTKLELIAPNHQ